jgi:hypothetical protein
MSTVTERKEQRGEMLRVLDSIEDAVLNFYEYRLDSDRLEFTIKELNIYVYATFPECAPDSPRRILNYLKNCGSLDYEVISRRRSQYRFKKLPPMQTKMF